MIAELYYAYQSIASCDLNRILMVFAERKLLKPSLYDALCIEHPGSASDD